MQIAFRFNSRTLMNPRNIRVRPYTRIQKYRIDPNDPLYDPVRAFLRTYERNGFPFNLISLCHATAVKKLGYPANIPRLLTRSLLVSGGLYLALNHAHPDLEIREHWGDFTAGFSHDFGVGLTLLAVSDMFDLPLDDLNPIEVRKQKSLDYAALLPNAPAILQIEVKGVTSDDSRSSARRSIGEKKRASGNTVIIRGGQTLISQQAIKIGVIVQASCQKRNGTTSPTRGTSAQSGRGLIEIIDPEPDEQARTVSKEAILAGKYWHFTGIALFAGLQDVAVEFAQRAIALTQGQKRIFSLRHLDVPPQEIFHHRGRKFVGVQWQPSSRPQSNQDVWFYQAADIAILQQLLAEEDFPDTHPYHLPDTKVSPVNVAENLFPDGSYFGIGLLQQKGLRMLNSENEGNYAQS